MSHQHTLYFFSYKAILSFQLNNPKYLDQICKTDLDIWDSFGRYKPVLKLYYSKLIYKLSVILEEYSCHMNE